MKRVSLLVSTRISCSSCCALFNSSRQGITFTGMSGTRIYEVSTRQKIAKIKEDDSVTVQIRKRGGGKQLLARREGYQIAPFVLGSTFNNTCLWNILFWSGFLVDPGMQRVGKWDNTIINIEMEKENTENKQPILRIVIAIQLRLPS